jgi:type IV secretory pathway TrbD component
MAEIDQYPPNWTVPIYHATQRPRQYLGVPEGLCIVNLLGSSAVTLLCWGPWLVIGILVHLAAKGLTAMDPYWLGIIRRYLWYALYYRG